MNIEIELSNMEDRIKILEMQVEFLLSIVDRSDLYFNSISSPEDYYDRVLLSDIYPRLTNDYIIDYMTHKNVYKKYKDTRFTEIERLELKEKYNKYLEALIIEQEQITIPIDLTMFGDE